METNATIRTVQTEGHCRLSLDRRAADRACQVVEVLCPCNPLDAAHGVSAALEHRDIVVVDASIKTAKVPRKRVRIQRRISMSLTTAPYSKNVHTNPAGTSAPDTSLSRKLRPPVKLMHSPETTGIVTQPLAGLTEPLHAVMVGERRCVGIVLVTSMAVTQNIAYRDKCECCGGCGRGCCHEGEGGEDGFGGEHLGGKIVWWLDGSVVG